MPGLVGYIKNHPDLLNNFVLEDMRNSICHKDWYTKEILFSDARLACTRCHNNTIQLSPQPYSRNGVYIWLDGEFYRTSRSDPELLMDLYKLDPDFGFLKRLDGVFTGIIYDTEQGKLFIVSDRFGLRRFYWTFQKNCLVWASELKAFLRVPGLSIQMRGDSATDFLELGYLPGDDTWFREIYTMPPGTLLTWDFNSGQLQRRRYWDWNEIPAVDHVPKEPEIIEHLAFLFKKAVQSRFDPAEFTGVTLSGGLDSRAILAALPEETSDVVAVTFGKKNSADVRIAQKVTEKKGCKHIIVGLNAGCWFTPRIEGVWFTDGELNLLHMHGIEMFEHDQQPFEVNLSGTLGGGVLGGTYIGKEEGAMDTFNNRGRRFIGMGISLSDKFVHNRMPFMDNELMDFTLAIPEKLRANAYIYKKMLLKAFPSYFRNIPWQKTGLPVRAPRVLTRAFLLGKIIQRKAQALYPPIGQLEDSYVNYHSWIRQEPARPFFTDLLTSSDNLIGEFVSMNEIRRKLDETLQRKKLHTEFLGRCLTLELWLQQAFKHRFR